MVRLALTHVFQTNHPYRSTYARPIHGAIEPEMRGLAIRCIMPGMQTPGSEVHAGQAGGTGGREYNGLAIASLVSGIFVFLWITSVLAIVLGFIALRQIRMSPETQKGRWMAIVGIALGFFWIAGLFLLAFALSGIGL